MNKISVLLVNPNSQTLASISLELSDYGYHVDQSNNLDDAMKMIHHKDYDVVVTEDRFDDTTLRAGDLIDAIRRVEKMTYIVIYSKLEDKEKVELLKRGADSLITRPAHPKVLKAQIVAFTRRAQDTMQEIKKINQATYKDITADREKRKIVVAGNSLDMSDKEYRIVRALMKAEGKPVTRKEIMNRVWGYYSEENRVVDVYMSKLRAKIGQDKILNIRGKGYMLY